jgi:hypothetical protein
MWSEKDQQAWRVARKQMEEAVKLTRKELPFTSARGEQYNGNTVFHSRRPDVVSLIEGNFTRGYPYRS